MKNKSLLLHVVPLLLCLVLGVVFPAGLVMKPIPVSAAEPSELVFTDDFEFGVGNWVVDGSFDTTTSQAHGGTHSLLLSGSGSIYKKIAVTDINSPNRKLILYWYPDSVNAGVATPIMSLEEGTLDDTDKSIEMFWDGANVYFNLYRYADGNRSSTTTSSSVAVDCDEWHKLEVLTDTTKTQIKIDDVAVRFGGNDYSTVLTNVYNWIRFATSTSVIVRDDDNHSENNSGWYPTGGDNQRVKKELVVPYDPSSVSSAQLNMKIDKENALIGSLVVYINGSLALALSESSISPGTPNPSALWYTYSIDKNLLVTGTNSIVIYATGGSTNLVFMIDTTTTAPNKSASSGDGGVTWNYNDLRRSGGAVDGEYMIYLSLVTAVDIGVYVDDVAIYKENIVNTTDLFGRTFDAMNATEYTGADAIYTIYRYLLTRDNAYLNVAKAGADSIQTAYNSGVKNMYYVRELAILSQFDNTRIVLLKNLADTMWIYRVNPTTRLPCYYVNQDGSVSNYTCATTDPPDALSVVTEFVYAYKATGESVYLNHAKAVMNAINTYVKRPSYNTIVTSVDARNGTVILWSEPLKLDTLS